MSDLKTWFDFGKRAPLHRVEEKLEKLCVRYWALEEGETKNQVLANMEALEKGMMSR